MEIYSQNRILEQSILDCIKKLLKKSSLTFSEEDIYSYKNNAISTPSNIEKVLYDNVSYIVDENNDKKIVIGCGFRFQNVLKYIAIDENYKGENLSDKIISTLTQEAFSKGKFDLFIYTKPQSVAFFLGLGFNLLIETDNMAIMENKKNKFDEWIDNIKSDLPSDISNIINNPSSKISAIVMNANPMTKGHKYLIDYASKHSDFLYIFILSNDVSMFSTKDRFYIATNECKNYKNIKVIEGGNYIISPATFPSYFLKDKNIVNTAQMTLDAEVFSKLIAPNFNIKTRYVGTEPFSITTDAYNEILKKVLPIYNIELVEIERYNEISATKVRENIEKYKTSNDTDEKNNILSNIKNVVTDTTYDVILNMLGI